jgi:hypothetical protein
MSKTKKENINDVSDVMDVNRTDELFDIAITRTEFKKPGSMDEMDIKKANIMIKVGNLHINTAKTKLGAIRIAGYLDNNRALTMKIKRKTRASLRKRAEAQ